MSHEGNDGYVSALAQRNASKAMQAIWSPRKRFETWRRIWLAAARAMNEVGLPVTREQCEEIAAHLTPTDAEIDRAREHERRVRHDVMAHVHALGEVAPKARPILHLGMTSQDVVCNADVLILNEALDLVCLKLARAIDELGDFAVRWKSLPTLGLTHYQPAQPTTVGRRAAQWAYDLWLCLDRLTYTRAFLRLRGLKSATGTQAAFSALCGTEAGRVDRLEERFLKQFGRTLLKDEVHLLTSQTYPRVADAFVISDLAATAAAAHKMFNDIRLLAGRKEMDEPMAGEQVGSSAMPYKQNPMRCERGTGLCRFVISLAQNPLDTAATQWFERTLDDSANRRVTLPEAFLALDGVLDLAHNIAAGLFVHEGMVRANLIAEMPFLLTETIMVAAVKQGHDRQEVHEAIRRHSREAAVRVKEKGLPNDLLDRLRGEPMMSGVDLTRVLDPSAYVGRAAEQVDKFITEIVTPLRERYGERIEALPTSDPGV
ncbi:MAG: adenylosuccinate lyase [Phycisphaerales bacterium]|nr:adenylosuccinate lyase [Phycisphaerales bacterium]